MSQPCHDTPADSRVWVVDDDADCRTMVREAVAGAAPGCEVNEIPSGVEAIEQLRRVGRDLQKRPDLIVLDVDMPGLSGLEVLRAAKADPALADIPVVMLTGGATPSLREASIAIGAAECYCKPVSATRFARTVVTAVEHCLRVAKARQFNRAAWRRSKADE